MSMMVSFVLSFFPRDVFDEILNLIESVSEDFPSYSYYDCIEQPRPIIAKFSFNKDREKILTAYREKRKQFVRRENSEANQTN